MGCPHVVRATEVGAQNNPQRCVLVDLILCDTQCHPGEGKKWAYESERCIRQPVCTTTFMGRVDSK
eukprot:10587620-Ditylum_brightwellii.AAC.1